MNELVSVVVPVYNGEQYIEKCIKSLLIQSYELTEILVVDDGSTDTTADICSSYTERGNIKYFKQKNSGPAAARNYGLSKAQGKYIAFVDADDYVDKDYISYLVENLKLYNADISSCGWKEIDENGRVISESEKVETECYHLADFNIPDNRIPYTVWHMLYRKEILDLFNVNFDTDICYQEDLLFNYRILLVSNRSVSSSRPLYNRVVNQSSLTNQKWSLVWYEKWFTIILAQERIVKLVEPFPVAYANAIYKQSLETAKIYALSKKHKIKDTFKIKKMKAILKLNKKKLRIVSQSSIKKMLFNAACFYVPVLYCKLRKYKLR